MNRYNIRGGRGAAPSGQMVRGNRDVLRERQVRQAELPGDLGRTLRMRPEEIMRERAASGWNQYEGEEEMQRSGGTARERMAGGRNQYEAETQMPDEIRIPGTPESVDRRQAGMPESAGRGQMRTPGTEENWQAGMPESAGRGRMGMPGMEENWQTGMPKSAERRQMETPGMKENWQTGMSESAERGRMGTSEPADEWHSVMPETGEASDMMQPFFLQPDYAEVLEEQRAQERDLRMLQSMYPDAAKLVLPHIEEECDKMEYEGSAMYDEYPDQTTVQLIEDRIYEQVSDQFPQGEEQRDEMLSMQYPGPPRRRPGRNWGRDLIRILLLDEMHHRRCRHGRCRRR